MNGIDVSTYSDEKQGYAKRVQQSGLVAVWLQHTRTVILWQWRIGQIGRQKTRECQLMSMTQAVPLC